MRLREARQPVDASSSSRTSTAKSGMRPTIERTRSGDALPVDVQLVVVEAVLLVPQAGAAERVHRVGDGDEVLEELRRHVLVGRVVAAPARAPSTSMVAQ